MINKIIGFIGCGNMGKAMLGSLISSGEIKKENIIVSAKTEASKEALEKEFEVKATNDNKEVAAIRVSLSYATIMRYKPKIFLL